MAYAPILADRMDAMIELHWQKYDHLPEKVDKSFAGVYEYMRQN